MDAKGGQSLKSLTVVETKFGESSAISDSYSDSTFEESFATRSYAGSFRLRYASVRRGKDSTVMGNKLAADSSAVTHPLSSIEEIEQQRDTPKQTTAVDSQQFSLNLKEARGNVIVAKN